MVFEKTAKNHILGEENNVIFLRNKKIHTEYDEKYVIVFEFLRNHILHKNAAIAGGQITRI